MRGTNLAHGLTVCDHGLAPLITHAKERIPSSLCSQEGVMYYIWSFKMREMSHYAVAWASLGVRRETKQTG